MNQAPRAWKLSCEATTVVAGSVVFRQAPLQIIGLADVSTTCRIVEQYVYEVFQAPPVGDEHPSESSGKSDIASSGAAESAAVDAELAIVIDAWENLAPDLRSAIIEIVRATAADGLPMTNADLIRFGITR
jgi:hypothetical protein